MKQCDICRGSGEVIIIKRITSIAGFSVNADRSSGMDFKADTVKEKCPKCDGKGMAEK